MISVRFLSHCLLTAAFMMMAGCAGEQSAPTVSETEAETPASEPVTEQATEKEEPKSEEPASTETEPAETTEESAEESQSETADTEEPESEASAVLLGTDELTAGIPGEGALTKEQIQAWIDDDANHTTLEIELPLGLAAGKAEIKIPEDNPLTRAKIELGRQLYFDRRLSADNSVSCADCHHPDEGFGRHTQFGVGIDGQEGNRNSPVSYNRILSGPQFWDGRAESLEEQAVGPIANPIEMGNTHEQAVETLKNIEGYVLQFEKIFPDGVTIDNVGKSIASFERVIVTGPAPFDYYEELQQYSKMDPEDLQEILEDDPDMKQEYESLLAAKEKHPMSDSAVRGRDLFFSKEVNCSACHVGANLSDEKYHNLGVAMDVEEPDLGRYTVTNTEMDKGAFKTPTIRNVALSAPYMHDGSQATLEEVVEHYNKGGVPNPHLSDKVVKLNLDKQQVADLVEFMKACTGAFPAIEMERLPE